MDITPDKSLIRKLGSAGYRTEQAVAELIDNALDARLPNVRERVQVDMDFTRRRITVSDDGRGMGRGDLTNAMTIAHETERADAYALGRFGIGMKSACSCLGRCFSITTSPMDSKMEYRAEYDEEKWLSDESRRWENFAIVERETPKLENWHGTRVEVWEMNVPIYPNQVSKFKESFGIRYSPHLESRHASIRINSVQCRPAEQEIVDGSRIRIDIPLSFNRKITGSLALLKQRSVRGNYGIHLFWNRRLIKAFAKFGFAAHPENARIVGSVDLNHVPVNYTKTGFLADSPEYRESEHKLASSDALKSILQKSRSEARQVPVVRSVFDYFASGNGSEGQRLDARVRAKTMQDAMGAAKPFTINADGKTVCIDFVSDGGGTPRYTRQTPRETG